MLIPTEFTIPGAYHNAVSTQWHMVEISVRALGSMDGRESGRATKEVANKRQI